MTARPTFSLLEQLRTNGAINTVPISDGAGALSMALPSHTNLLPASLLTDDHPQYHDGSLAYTGALDMGGFGISNASDYALIAGDSLATHASRHAGAGADAITTLGAVGMTGAISLANQADSLKSGAFTLQTQSGVADGAGAVGYSLDTLNSLATVGARNLIVKDAGTNLLEIGSFNTPSGAVTGRGIATTGHVAIGEAATVDQYSILNVVGEMNLNVVSATGAAMNLVANMTLDGTFAHGNGLKMVANVSGTGLIPFPSGLQAILNATSANAGGWGGNPDQVSPFVIQAQLTSEVGSASLGNWVSGFQARTPMFGDATGQPSTFIQFEAQLTKNFLQGTGYAFYAWSCSYGLLVEQQLIRGIYLKGDNAGGDISFGATESARMFYDGTNFIIDPNLAGAGKVLIGLTGNDDMDLTNIGIAGAITHTGSTLGFYNTAPVAQSAAYTPLNVTPDRAYDATATTLAEIADVLGTLIADLQLTGLIG